MYVSGGCLTPDLPANDAGGQVAPPRRRRRRRRCRVRTALVSSSLTSWTSSRAAPCSPRLWRCRVRRRNLEGSHMPQACGMRVSREGKGGRPVRPKPPHLLRELRWVDLHLLCECANARCVITCASASGLASPSTSVLCVVLSLSCRPSRTSLVRLCDSVLPSRRRRVGRKPCCVCCVLCCIAALVAGRRARALSSAPRHLHLSSFALVLDFRYALACGPR